MALHRITPIVTLLAALALPGAAQVRPTGPAPALQAPGLLGSWALSDKSALLSWTDDNDVEDRYEVLRATAIAGPYTHVIDLQGAPGTNTTFFAQDNGLKKSRTYFYIIRIHQGATSADTPATVTTLGKGHTIFESIFPSKLTLAAAIGGFDEETVQVANPFTFDLQVQVTQPLNPPFSVDPGNTSMTLPPGETNLTFAFAPTSKGKKTGKWKVDASTPLATSKVTISLTGKVTPPAAP